MERIAPNASAKMWMLRLVPDYCSMDGLQRLSLCEVADAHELMDLREEIERRAMARAERPIAAQRS